MTNAWAGLPATDHHRTATGPDAVLSLGATQDAAGEQCPDCGRTLNPQQWFHDIRCPAYMPHPHSLAAEKLPPEGFRITLDGSSRPHRWVEAG